MSLKDMLDPSTIRHEPTPEGVAVRTPSGWAVALAGPHVILYFSWLLLAIGIIYSLKGEMTARAAEHHQISINQRDLVEQLEVQNWLLAMEPAKRPPLKRPPGADRYLLKGD